MNEFSLEINQNSSNSPELANIPQGRYWLSDMENLSLPGIRIWKRYFPGIINEISNSSSHKMKKRKLREILGNLLFPLKIYENRRIS
jgi:hypothetical protein